MKRLSLVTALVLLPALAGAQDAPKPKTVGATDASATPLPLKREPRPTKPEISAEDLMTRLYIFADDSMMGRDAGTLGSVKATEYLAAEAKRLGLVPAGDNGTYFQTLPVKTRKVDPMSSVIAGGASLKLGTEWAMGGNASINKADLETVYGGVVGDTVHRISPEQAAGKLVMLSMPASNDAVSLILSDSKLAPSTAAATGILVPRQVQGLLPYVTRPGVIVADGDDSGASRIYIGAAAANKLFAKSVDALQIGDEGAKVSINGLVDLKDNPFPVRNVVGIIPGSDPALKNSYVAVGAHSDHVGMSPKAIEHDSILVFNRIVRPGGAEDEDNNATPAQIEQINKELAELRAKVPARQDSIFNGADDDGSGSVSVLEIAEYLSTLKTKPKRSTLIVWHVGEEKGMWGSHYFTEHPTVPRDSIIAQLNMDMVGRGAASDETGKSKDGEALHGGPDYLQLVGSRRLSTELGDLVERVNTVKKYNFKFDYGMDANGHPMDIYCRSDHAEYARWGIPIVFATTGGHSSYHQLTDEPQYIDYPHMTRVAKLFADVAMELGNNPKRPVVDKPKPDPRGQCKQ